MPDMIECPRHPGQRTTATCLHCGKSICWLCRQDFGYYCSAECKQAAKQKSFAPEDVQREQFTEVGKTVGRWSRMVKLYVLPAVAVVILGIVVYKLTSKAGKHVWEYRPPQDRAISGIALWDKWLFFCADDNALYRLDTTSGKATSVYSGAAGLSECTPMLTEDGKCLVWDNIDLVACDAARGQTAWRYGLAGFLESLPIISEGRVFFACAKDRIGMFTDAPPVAGQENQGPTAEISAMTGIVICAVSLSNGDKLWERKVERSFSPESISAAGGTVYITRCEFAGEGSQFVIEAVEAATGKGKWKGEIKDAGYSVHSAPAGNGIAVLTEKKLYYVTSAGAVKWQREAAQGMWKPVVSGDRLFMLSDKFESISLDDGHTLWEAAVGDTASEPLVVGDLVFVSGLKRVLRESAKEGGAAPPIKAPGLEDLVQQVPGLEDINYRLEPTLFAFDISTGKARATISGTGGRLLGAAGSLFAINEITTLDLMDQLVVTTARITAVNPRTCRSLWTKTYHVNMQTWASDGRRFYYHAISPKTKLITFPFVPSKPQGNVIGAVSVGH